MSHFLLETDVNNALRMDVPLTRGPLMRWQRKALEADCSGSANNSSLNASSSTKTPVKTANRSAGQTKTPSTASHSGKKTPKSAGKLRTPSSKGPKTPNAGDRFIPNRSSTQFEMGHYKLGVESDDDDQLLSPSQQEFQRVMNGNLNGDILDSKIIAYKAKAPSAPEGLNNNLRVLYSTSKCHSATKTMRQVPQVPERILDAPEILDDYYLNLLDWSVNNLLAVCLGSSLYLWNANNGEIQQLMQMEQPGDYIGAVSWIKEGNFLAVGTSSGDVELWDVSQEKKVRTMTGHSARVGCLSWNSYILSSGSRSGNIHHHDVRVANHHIGTLNGHTQEVCGLKWSPDGRYLASGGNDNLLNIWSSNVDEIQPIHTFSQHLAAVKALAWCPWQPSLLASGGGTADRNIRFWNCNTGVCLNNIDTKSQVCAILWSKEHRELISSHGYAQNQLVIWKYPKMNKLAELTGHTARVLHMALSPDGTTVVSAGADETIRLWKCFAEDEKKKKTLKSTSKNTSSAISRALIR
ncbi:cell division cycle protein 20 homolog [Gigantopelta aegis]|uniref:cell division cycle protein 20 homolog n=1 Tax=Gigantopelta aegis TaxID=1735272 RepID=UPI001B889F0A|nr:cell division cycle protein 20 homolog [Gigantopelta aegis]XP_041357188.1 cell division cycle protein 20 homolog [Gigantopelta aegis]